MSILCKFRQIRPFNRDFFEPLVIFCCNLSAWAQKWQRQSTETPASTEICDKTTIFGSIFIQNVQIWAKFNEFGPFHRVLLKPLVIFCCILSAWAQKWQRQSTQTLASTEICDKTTFWAQFPYKTSKFGPNSTNLDPFTEFFWNPWSFFVVFYQPEHKNDRDNQHKRWQVPKFKAKQRFGLNFHTKRPNLSKMSPNSTVSARFLWTFGHFLVYPIRLSKKMPKDFKIFTDKYRNLRQNNGIA